MNKKPLPEATLGLHILSAAAAASAALGAASWALGGPLGATLCCVALAGIVPAVLLAGKALQGRKKTGSEALAAVRAPTTAEAVPQDRIDELTGLANMNGFKAWFAEKAGRAAQDNKAIIVMAADLANFDQLVKARGTDQANAVLKEAAQRVSTFTGEDGIAARVEGDEFAAIATVVPSRSLELAAEQAGKLAEMLQRPVELPTGVVWIGGSVGAATGGPLEGLEVFERAKAALKKAKTIGRGHYFVDGLTVAEK